MLKPGDAAPDFALKDADGKDVRLSSHLGKAVVLYFYPKDHTAGCTIEAKGFRDQFADIQAAGAIVLGVSLDLTDKHCTFRDKHGLPFSLLSDPDGRVHDLYSAWLTTLFGKTHFAVRRCTFIIDGNGIVRRVYKHVNPIGHAKDVLRELAAIQVPAPQTP
ncbi:MAG: peroxiredoxin [bacterium]